MEKKIPLKNIYLFLIISIGLVVLGISSTYAVFTAEAEITDPIVFSSSLTSDQMIVETVEVVVPAGKIITTTLNISNSSGSTLNYVVWYDNSSDAIKVAINSGNSQGVLADGENTSVVIDIRNKSSKDIVVIVGISSGANDIILDDNMSHISSSGFLNSDQFSYDNSNTGVNCSNVTCVLDELYDLNGLDYAVVQASALNVGDYIYYKPSVKSYPVDTSKTGYTGTVDQTIYPEELELWRVLNKNADGTIDLISEYTSSTDVYFQGKTGYLNFVGYLNVLAKQYETEGITEKSRYFGFNGQTEYIEDTEPSKIFVNPAPWKCSTGETCDSPPVESNGGGDKLYTTDFNRVNTVLGTRVAYKVGTTTATSYWTASRSYSYYSDADYYWFARYVFVSGGNSNYSLYFYSSSGFNEFSPLCALRPIVTLKSGLLYGNGMGTKDSPMKIITS